MFRVRWRAAVVAAVLSFVGLVFGLHVEVVGQHDPHRNATQAIALGDLKLAEARLAGADAKVAETRFVRMMVALKRGDTAAATREAEAALDAGLPFSRLAAGPRELIGPLHESDTYAEWRTKFGDPVIVHGPMLGAATNGRASVWLRTSRAAKVQLKIGDRTSAPVESAAGGDFTAVVSLDGLRPDWTYPYQILIDGKPSLEGVRSLRTFPAERRPARFSVAFGGGAGYVPKWERMWDTILGFKPTALLLLGDNVYIDQPKHSLCQDYCYYRRQSRPEWRRLVSATPTIAIYDDHDFGTNDCVPGPSIEKPPWKRQVWNRFRRNWVNPYFGGGDVAPGCWTDFYIGDVHFILLDGRYYRDLKGGSMLGAVQKAWLKKTLKSSQGVFKVLASPVPWTAGIKPGSRDPWDGFPEEREEIFDFIESNRVSGVLLISADRHRTDLRKTKRPSGYDLFELESSRLTNRHTHKVVRTAGLIWGYNEQCSFATMRFDTRQTDPAVTLECVDIEGTVQHRYTLHRSELTYPRGS